jgi:hypothetical protein
LSVLFVIIKSPQSLEKVLMRSVQLLEAVLQVEDANIQILKGPTARLGTGAYPAKIRDRAPYLPGQFVKHSKAPSVLPGITEPIP